MNTYWEQCRPCKKMGPNRKKTVPLSNRFSFIWGEYPITTTILSVGIFPFLSFRFYGENISFHHMDFIFVCFPWCILCQMDSQCSFVVTYIVFAHSIQSAATKVYLHGVWWLNWLIPENKRGTTVRGSIYSIGQSILRQFVRYVGASQRNTVIFVQYNFMHYLCVF